MSNMFDYLIWRGDLSFGNAPLCPIDALIFSMLAYMDLRKVVPADPSAEPVRLSDAVEKYFALPGSHLPHVTGASNHVKLLRKLSESERFGGLRLFGAKRQVNRSENMQFGAISVLLPGQNLFVAYQGTDDTLVGWKEDFMMSYECPVPAQLSAVNYLNEVGAAYPMRRIFTGGHSKGGNLATYAAVKSGPGVYPRIRGVYNNDGPGFCDGTLYTPEYREMRDKIHTYMPQSSIVAVLLEHDWKHKIVVSNGTGILQHDAYTWQVRGTEFTYTEKRTAFGEKTEAVLDRFIGALSPERKRMFCEALFEILESTEKDTVSGIIRGKKQSLKQIMKAYGDLPDDLRGALNDSVAELKKSRKAVEKAERLKKSAP